jgi:hypothetical protein
MSGGSGNRRTGGAQRPEPDAPWRERARAGTPGRRQPGASPPVTGMSAYWCTIGDMRRYVRGPLAYELSKDSPIRRFFYGLLTPRLKDAQAAYRAGAGPLPVPGVPREAADQGAIGTAADWMLRMMVHPSPSLLLAAQDASLCGLLRVLRELAFMRGYRDGGAACAAQCDQVLSLTVRPSSLQV